MKFNMILHFVVGAAATTAAAAAAQHECDAIEMDHV